MLAQRQINYSGPKLAPFEFRARQRGGGDQKKFSALTQSTDYESAILKLQLDLSHNRISKSRHKIFTEATDLRPNGGLCRKPRSEFGNAPATEKICDITSMVAIALIVEIMVERASFK
jgi:hypothetical protein